MLTFELASIFELLLQPALSAAEQGAIEQAVDYLAQQRRCSRPQAAQALHRLAFDSKTQENSVASH